MNIIRNWRHHRGLLFILGLLLAVSLTLWIGCSEHPPSPVASDEGDQQSEVVLSKTAPEVQRVMSIQERHTDALLAIEDVVGTATGITADGKPAILVMTKRELRSQRLDKKALLPDEIEGVPVVELVTGEIKALKGRPGGGGGFDPTARHRPAPNGVSIGHPNITAGTLGCLVSAGNTTYILSNNHVMADENRANIGDPIYQPGPFDGGTSSDQIATLSDYKTIVFSTSANNVIDAAIAQVNPADVTGATDPNAGSYGSPRAVTVEAAVRMKVQKYGRTTQHTTGRVQGINATVNVGYDTGTARFVNQIVIGGGSFSAGGDSGSLIVVNGGSDDRKPVGLLFAGGGGTTIANPIDAVLAEFGVSVVGD